MVVNNNAAAVLLVLAAIARDRQVLVSRGESVEIGGGFRIPEVMEQSGAHLVDVGTTNRTRLADYRKAIGRKQRRRRRDPEGASQQLPRRGFRRVDDRRRARHARRAGGRRHRQRADRCQLPVARRAPPAWLHGEPAARQTLEDGAALVTFSGDKLFGGPQAGIIAGRADLVAQCEQHPLARALRPGGHVMAAMQRTALAYLDRTAATEIPFWAMVTATIDELQHRVRRRSSRLPAVGEVDATEAVPGAGSAPGATIPSVGIRLAGDHLAVLRSCDPPVDRPHARRVDVAGSAHGRSRQRRRGGGRTATMRVVATAGHVDHGKSSLVEALTGTNPDRFEEERSRGLTIDLGFAHTTLPSGEGISFVDVPGHVRFLRNMLAGVGGVDACVFVVAATEGGSRRARSTCASSSWSGRPRGHRADQGRPGRRRVAPAAGARHS